ncbi:MAG: GNAT family N-acetyltransferase [Flavobacteriales bacterium]
MNNIFIKSFYDLTKDELYNILRLRSEVFIVEQNCVYQDIDQKDQSALHVFFKKNNKIIAYTRIFKPNDYFKYSSIGRVVVIKKERGSKIGSQIMNFSIKKIEEIFNEKKIKISAQKYLINFYEKLGFSVIGDEYLEDGIPHIAMIKN